VLPIALIAVLAAVPAAGPRTGLAACCGVGGRESPDSHRALASAARTSCGAGFVFAAIALVMMFGFLSVGSEDMSPADLAQAISYSIAAPMIALVMGRLLLAPWADAAAARAGEPGLRTFGGTGWFMTDDLSVLLDARAVLFLLAMPPLVLATAYPLRAVGRAIRDGLDGAPAELPAELRSTSAAILRNLAGVSFGTGLVVFLGSMVATFNAIAGSGGQVGSGHILESMGTMFLGPVYGLALKAFLYDPLAAGLDPRERRHGARVRAQLVTDSSTFGLPLRTASRARSIA